VAADGLDLADLRHAAVTNMTFSPVEILDLDPLDVVVERIMQHLAGDGLAEIGQRLLFVGDLPTQAFKVACRQLRELLYATLVCVWRLGNELDKRILCLNVLDGLRVSSIVHEVPFRILSIRLAFPVLDRDLGLPAGDNCPHPQREFVPRRVLTFQLLDGLP